MHANFFVLYSKEKNKLALLDNWSILKDKNKIVLKFSIAIMKLNFLVFILIIFHLESSINAINTKKNIFVICEVICYRKLEDNLIFFF
jgi:hypothetical protein